MFLCVSEDVKGHVRVGYLFCELLMEWEREAERTRKRQLTEGSGVMEMYSCNFVQHLCYLIICAFRDSKFMRCRNRQIIHELLQFCSLCALFMGAFAGIKVIQVTSYPGCPVLSVVLFNLRISFEGHLGHCG